jgi:LCP family protein required for cell wall assembly
VVVCLGAAWGLADAYNSVGEIPRFALPEGVLDERVDEPGEPRNILLVGTTENEGIDPDDPLVNVREDTQLADTIMLLRVEPETQRAVVLSINRDIYVDRPIDDFGGGKINSAYQIGGDRGMELLINVVSGYFDVEIHNFARVNFAGFRQLIDEIDGVPVYFEDPARDLGSGFQVDAGCQVLDGVQALNYVRSRKYEIDRGDGWVDADGRSDLDRAARQRDFLLLTLERALDKGAGNPVQLRDMINATVDGNAVELDTELSVDNILDIARSFGDFDPERLERFSVQSADGFVGKQSVLLYDEAASKPFLDVFRGLGSTSTNANVSVKVVDARDPEVRAEDVQHPDEDLSAIDIFVRSRNSAREADRTERTLLEYSPDQLLLARQLAVNLAGVPEYREVAGRGILTLTVGDDWQGVTLIPLPEAERAGQLPGDAVGSDPDTASGSTTTTPDDGSDDAGSTDEDASGVIGKPPPGITCE